MWEAGVLRLIATWAHGDCGVQLDSEALQRNEYLYLGGASRWEARRFECPYLVLFVASEYLPFGGGFAGGVIVLQGVLLTSSDDGHQKWP